MTNFFQITAKPVSTCPIPTMCTSGQVACGSLCYNATEYCCISGYPAPASECNTPNITCLTNLCDFTLENVGSLHDGQLRLRYGAGAYNVSFTLHDGILKDNRGQICYFADNLQFQCNDYPQTSNYTRFEVEGKFLAYGE